MAVTAFAGFRGSEDWTVDGQRPESYREGVIHLYPNGGATLTALSNMLPSTEVDDPTYNWFNEVLASQGGSVTGIYQEVSLQNLRTDAPAADTVVYCKVPAATVQEFRQGHTARLTADGDPRNEVVGEVVFRADDGANSILAVKLFSAFGGSNINSYVDLIYVAGSINEQGATIPDSITYDPTKFQNITQIFRTPLALTRTAMKQVLRTPGGRENARKKSLLYHALEIEKAFIGGEYYDSVGPGGKRKTATRGLIEALRLYVPANVSDFRDAGYSASWSSAGKTWINDSLTTAFTYGNTEKLALVGTSTLNYIQQVVEANSTMNLVPGAMQYGIKVLEWITPFGSLFLKTSPIFAQDASRNTSMLIVEPEFLWTKYVDDTFFKEDESYKKNTNNSRDGIEEEYVTEIGLGYDHLETMMYLSGFGTTSA